jgi:membrane fusion protein, multidrug efflux system
VRVAIPPEVAREGVLRPGLSVVVRVDRRDRGEEPVTKTAAASR